MNKGDESADIGPSSKISIVLLGGIFVVALTATWGGARWATRVDTRLESIEDRLLTGTNDRWTRLDMLLWVELLRVQNPTLNIPTTQ